MCGGSGEGPSEGREVEKKPSGDGASGRWTVRAPLRPSASATDAHLTRLPPGTRWCRRGPLVRAPGRTRRVRNALGHRACHGPLGCARGDISRAPLDGQRNRAANRDRRQALRVSLPDASLPGLSFDSICPASLFRAQDPSSPTPSIPRCCWRRTWLPPSSRFIPRGSSEQPSRSAGASRFSAGRRSSKRRRWGRCGRREGPASASFPDKAS